MVTFVPPPEAAALFGEDFASGPCSRSREVVSADVISSDVGLRGNVGLGIKGLVVATTCSPGDEVGGGAGGGRGGGGGGGGGSVDRRVVWKCLTCLVGLL